MMTRNSTLPRAAALCLLFASFFGLASVHAAGGLLIFTANGSPYVNAVLYETFSSPSAHLSYITVKGGGRTQVQSQGIIANIPFPTRSNVSPDDAASIISQTEAYAARYPQHAKLLQGVGDLWRRSAEAAKLEQSRAPVVSPAATPSQSGKSFVAPGLETVIPLIRTKPGQQFKNARITRFENDQASVSHSEGVTKVGVADISNLPAFPPDVKAAVEKVQTDYQTYKKAEEERIAESKKEQERIAKIEQERIAKEVEKKEQERLAGIEETKRSDEVLGKLAALKPARKDDDQVSPSAKTTSNSQSPELNSNDQSVEKYSKADHEGIDQAAVNMMNVNFFTSDSAKVIAEIASRYDSLSDSQKDSMQVGNRSMRQAFEAAKAARDVEHTEESDAIWYQIEKSGHLGQDIRYAAANVGQRKIDIAFRTGALSTASVLANAQGGEKRIINRMLAGIDGQKIQNAFGGGRAGAEAFAEFQAGSGSKGFSDSAVIADRLMAKANMSRQQAESLAFTIATRARNTENELAQGGVQSGAFKDIDEGVRYMNAQHNRADMSPQAKARRKAEAK